MPSRQACRQTSHFPNIINAIALSLHHKGDRTSTTSPMRSRSDSEGVSHFPYITNAITK
ncbi:MAG: hypothetical protein KME54_29010 [Tolypothrix brevis GSE-NOS-MK-07-07A]|nr:hypothetical protein [Tolypothrix brevis GSE-NOS-MK-07-07A]MBW4480770.1 hypothetical protein [Tolypothrix brevis GSE-NOS-MK-07-07A]